MNGQVVSPLVWLDFFDLHTRRVTRGYAHAATEIECPTCGISKEEGSPTPKDPNLILLLKLYQAKMIEPYVLLNAADDGIAQDYPAYREKNREKLERYLSEFVVPSLEKP